MNLQITNIDDTFNFKSSGLESVFSLGNYKRRTGIQKRYGKSGGVVTGDRQVDARDVKINFNITSAEGLTADNSYITQLETIIGLFRIDKAPFYVEDIDNSRRCEVELESMNDRPAAKGVTYRIGENNLDMIMLDGYWEDLTATIVSSDTGGMANNDTLDANNDSEVDCYHIITVSPYTDNSEFSIINVTTGAICTLATAGFVVGTTFTIDCQLGTIELDDGTSSADLSSALADGTGFISLDPGINTFRYESLFSAADVTITFRKRYAF